MAESPPYSSTLSAEAKKLHQDMAGDIEKFSSKKFTWGSVKNLPIDIEEKWKKVFAHEFDVSDVAISYFDREGTTINYAPHSIILAPFSDIVLQPVDNSNKVDPQLRYTVISGCYTYLHHSSKVKLLSGNVDILVAKLRAT